MSVLDPENNHRNDPEGAEALGALVVAGGQGAELLAAVDQPLGEVAAAVGGAVERAAAALGPQARDGLADASPPAVGAVFTAGVALVADHPLGADRRPTAAGTIDRALLEQLLEDGRLVLLAGREHQRQRPAAALGAQVDLRAEAAPTAP